MKKSTEKKWKPKGMTLKQLKQAAIDRGQLRWEPKVGDMYYYVSTDGTTVKDQLSSWFMDYINLNNYFRTRKLALSAAKQIKALIKTLPHA